MFIYKYKVDYAKSGRSHCRGCERNINLDELRLALRVQAQTFDGIQDNWYHVSCFFKEHDPGTSNNISGYVKLEHKHQVALKSIIGKLRASLDTDTEEIEKFYIEYSNVMETTCHSCKSPICKGEIRITKAGHGRPLLFHMECFIENRHQLEYFAGGESLPGFLSLSEEDKLTVKDAIQRCHRSGSEIKKARTDSYCLQQTISNDYKIKQQNDMYQMYKAGLKHFKKGDIKQILFYNNQKIYYTHNVCVDLLADCLAFGALQRCGMCQGQFILDSLCYHCTGINQWTKCSFVTQDPVRSPMIIPKEYSCHPFFAEYDPKVGKRIFEATSLLPCNSKPSTSAAPQVVDPAFLDRIDAATGTVASSLHILKEENIADWGADPATRVSQDIVDAKPRLDSPFASKSRPKQDKITLKIIEGTAVDPESGLAEEARVFTDEAGNKYTAVLTQTDLVSQKNSHYRMQVLQSNVGNRYWLFCYWGRISFENIQRHKLEDFDDITKAVAKFEKVFYKKTKNEWRHRHEFVKIPGLYNLVAVSYSRDVLKGELTANADYDLPDAVQQLIIKIFDIRLMKDAMLNYELDLETMPLGKLSNSQIILGYLALNDILKLVEKGSVSETLLKEATSRFYSQIPHNLGLEKIPLLNTVQLITNKIKMLDHLTDIEAAYNLYEQVEGEWDILRAHGALRCDIEPLGVDCDEYRTVAEYLANTHGQTHCHFSLQIEHVFKLSRQGEEDRFAPFKGLHNRRLLWHGSQLTNFAGILSQGLRIAPRESPSEGYMFGKGIYFADMVSKSANYCEGEPNGCGLLLLSEVALGNMKACYSAQNVKLGEGEHSAWGVGRTRPDPAQDRLLGDGTLVPLGTPVTHDVDTQLAYNEFIVYDAAQVNLKYLVQVTFLC